MPAVKTCPLDPTDLMARFRHEALQRGFREEPFGESAGVTLSAFTRRAMGRKPRIYLSSGVHGDEPAPPAALLTALIDDTFDDRATWFLVPLINPVGFIKGQRENGEGIDLNRDYLSGEAREVRDHIAWLVRQPRFDLALCLHEDWEAQGFYLYELCRALREDYCRNIRAAVTAVLPIEDGDEIDGRPVTEHGIIRPESDPALRDLWPEAIYLFKHQTDHCLTFETPTPKTMKDRIAGQNLALRCAIDQTLESIR